MKRQNCNTGLTARAILLCSLTPRAPGNSDREPASPGLEDQGVGGVGITKYTALPLRPVLLPEACWWARVFGVFAKELASLGAKARSCWLSCLRGNDSWEQRSVSGETHVLPSGTVEDDRGTGGFLGRRAPGPGCAY